MSKRNKTKQNDTQKSTGKRPQVKTNGSPIDAVVTKSKKSTWLEKALTSLRGVPGKVWGIIGVISTITGVTLYQAIWPTMTLTLKDIDDPLHLIFAFKNEGYFEIDSVQPILYINYYYTFGRDTVENVPISDQMIKKLHIGKSEPYDIEYDLNKTLYHYLAKPKIIFANIALSVNYKYWFFNRNDRMFLNYTVNPMGQSFWKLVPSQTYVDSIGSTSYPSKYRIKIDTLIPKSKLLDPSMVPPPPKTEF